MLDKRAFWRHAKQQHCEEDMKKLEKNDPRLFAEVLKGFVKERTQAAASQNKLKFGIQNFKKTIES